MLCEDGKTGIQGFLLGNTLLLALIYPDCGSSLTWIVSYCAVYILFVLLFLRLSLSYKTFQVCARATSLGFTFSGGILIWYLQNHSVYRLFGLYLCVLSFFHMSDYMAISIANPQSLNLNSFMLNHSLAYHIAAVTSWLEFFIECYFFPELKSFSYLSYIGLIICVCGEILRKSAIISAGSNFHHIIQSTKSEKHRLVTSGPFRLCRHPSYVGWFFWSIATQIILINPLCIIAYAIASWRFFDDRIEYEEITLINFFGHEYLSYQKCTPTGIPFIKGYLLPVKN